MREGSPLEEPFAIGADDVLALEHVVGGHREPTHEISVRDVALDRSLVHWPWVMDRDVSAIFSAITFKPAQHYGVQFGESAEHRRRALPQQGDQSLGGPRLAIVQPQLVRARELTQIVVIVREPTCGPGGSNSHRDRAAQEHGCRRQPARHVGRLGEELDLVLYPDYVSHGSYDMSVIGC